MYCLTNTRRNISFQITLYISKVENVFKIQTKLREDDVFPHLSNTSFQQNKLVTNS